jgi:hypothetical protein
MKGKAGLVVGMAAGYVLGARDGRGRYEQIMTQAERLWNDPKVQKKAAEAQDLVKAKAPLVTDKVSQVADKATGKATGASTGKDTDATGSTGAGTTTPPAPAAGTVPPTTGTGSLGVTPPAPKSVTPASAPVAKGPELHADPTPTTKPGDLHG